MARRKRAEQQNDVGLTTRQTKRKKPLSGEYLVDIDPLTDNQKKLLFDSYAEQKHLVAYGCAGTGKTFITLYNALREVLDEKTPYEKIYLVRSLVATREIGFLPGSYDDKISIYQIPYKNMVKYMFQMPSDVDFEMLYGNLKSQETIKFWSTSFLRGTTLDNSIIIVDEFQNMSYHELDSIITRVGENSKIMFCGDASQSDLQKTNERNGIVDFMTVLRKMPSFDIIEFGVDDIVRSGLVKEYIIAKRSRSLMTNPLIEKYNEIHNKKEILTRFNHLDNVLPKLERETIDGVRYYSIPDEDQLLKLVSITSVTSHFNKEIFVKWRKRVGNEEADRITKASTSRGTDLHTLSRELSL
jgi:phosphate starvation-inducible protein PhoH